MRQVCKVLALFTALVLLAGPTAAQDKEKKRGFGGGFSTAPGLLRNESVQKEIKLSDEQIEKVKKAAEEVISKYRDDLGKLIVLRKLRGEATDTGEEATLRVLAAQRRIIGHEIEFCPRFAVGHSRVPTIAGGVFHAWYVSRLLHAEAEVIRETGDQVSRASYLVPLQAKLRAAYGLSEG